MRPAMKTTNTKKQKRKAKPVTNRGWRELAKVLRQKYQGWEYSTSWQIEKAT
jgi:hypothetical protein